MGYRIFEEGPQGRSIYVDENGRLVINAENSASGLIYQYGPKGRPIMVDGSGALLITGAVSPSVFLATSGYLQSQIDTIMAFDWQDSVLSKTYLVPPSGAIENDRYIVAIGASGAWTGQDDNIVEHNGKVYPSGSLPSGTYPSGSWNVTVANEGMATWVEDENVIYVYNGATWVAFGAIITHNNLAGLQGGQPTEYYHLTANRHNILTAQSGKLFSNAKDSIPEIASTYDLGSVAYPFDNVYAESGNFKDGLQVGSGSFRFSPDGTMRNGTTTLNIDDIVDMTFFANASGDIQTQITNNDTDIAFLQYASGNLDTRILSNDTDITFLQYASGNLDTRVITNTSDIATMQAVSGKWYRNDADLIPAAASTYDIGSAADSFKDLYAGSGSFTTGLGVTTTSDTVGMELTTTASGTVLDIDAATGDAILIGLNKGAGSANVIQITNAGTGYDIRGNANTWNVDSAGAATFVSANGMKGIHRETISGGPSAWTVSGVLYYSDVTHGLGVQNVIVQYYDSATNESIGVDHHEAMTTNLLRVFASSSGSISTVILG